MKKEARTVDTRNRICIIWVAFCESALAAQHESKYDAAIRRRHLTNRNARCRTVLAFMILRWATDTRWLINMEKYEWVVPCTLAKVYPQDPTLHRLIGGNTMRILITIKKKLESFEEARHRGFFPMLKLAISVKLLKKKKII